MIAQIFPARHGSGSAVAPRRAGGHTPGWGSAEQPTADQGTTGRNGPLRCELHAAPRCERAGLDPGRLPRSAGARRLRRTLLLSGARPARRRRGWQRAALGHPVVDHDLPAIFGRAGYTVDGALRHERNSQSRLGGAGDPLRQPEEPCRHHGGGGVRRPRPQISDLGAWTLPRTTRGGHRGSARDEEATGLSGGGARRAQSTGMMAGSDGKRVVAGGPARHIPVLARQAFEQISPHEGGVYIDGTFGAGGHTRALLEVGATVIGIDRDQTAIANGFSLVEASGGRLTLVEDRFSNLDVVAQNLGVPTVDGILLDIGVSSMQLDQAERGFSFRNDGPLDMRMGGEGPSAADLVNSAAERDLAFIIATLGEERFARPIARAIVKARRDVPITTTRALSDVIGTVLKQRQGEMHPATRTFQALRMFVNDELGELVEALAAAERMLKAGGKLVVISFHSLEDRIVKTFFAERSRVGGGSRHQPEVALAAPSFTVLTRKPAVADDEEIGLNPRSRSAKLRAAERTGAAAHRSGPSDLLPRLPVLADIMKGR